MNDQTISPIVGQWYRTRHGKIVKCIDDLQRHTDLITPFPMVIMYLFKGLPGIGLVSKEGKWLRLSTSGMDLVEHLPDCTGFKYRPDAVEATAGEAKEHADES